MKLIRSAVAALLATTLIVPLAAQAPVVNPEGPRMDGAARLAAALERLAFRPDVNGVAMIQSQLAGSPEVSAAARASAADLRAQAAALNKTGRTSEALRLLNQAIAVTSGKAWSAAAYSASLTLDVGMPVSDRGATLVVALRQLWVEVPPGGAGTISFRLLEDKTGGAEVKNWGARPVILRDFVADPRRFALTLRDVASGHFRIEATLADGTRLLAGLDIVDGLHAAATDVFTRAGKITGHDAAKGTILYPFSLARQMNAHGREALNFDFTKEIARSQRLLGELEAGRDSIERATGDSKRAYVGTNAGDIVPYRIYVPKGWDGKAHLPMIVFLHGAGGDENNGLERANGLIPKLAEERVYIIVSPLGYRMNSPYGAQLPTEASGFGNIANPDARRLALSEQDVLNVTDIVAREYGADPKRIYLMGNSMGGMGTWHLAAKYPQRWAAVAPAAGGVNTADYNYATLKAVPMMAVAGELDGARSAVEAAVAKARAAGAQPVYRMIPGGTHGTGIEIAMPAIFDFFAANRRK